MKIMTTTICGYHAATLRVRVPAAVFPPRFTGGVRLLADGGTTFAPSGPSLTD
jgi:hypothetical protein